MQKACTFELFTVLYKPSVRFELWPQVMIRKHATFLKRNCLGKVEFLPATPTVHVKSAKKSRWSKQKKKNDLRLDSNPGFYHAIAMIRRFVPRKGLLIVVPAISFTTFLIALLSSQSGTDSLKHANDNAVSKRCTCEEDILGNKVNYKEILLQDINDRYYGPYTDGHNIIDRL